MKSRFKLAAGIFAAGICVLAGCERDKGRQDLLLLPAEGAEEQSAQDMQAFSGLAGEGINVSDQSDTQETKDCVIHICGAVNHPGVYTLEAESRIYQAIDEAGGFCEDADPDYLNQADFVTDGMKIYVPTRAEVEEAGIAPEWNSSGAGGAQKDDSLININTAGEELLRTLPGIGSSKAKSIIAYREKNGAFQKTEDIMNVEGIKDGLFQKIKDSITV